jgi:hypothetical protein
MNSQNNLGIQFPQGADGASSTTKTGAAILAAALSPLDSAASRAAGWESRWRRNYPKHFRRLVEAGLMQPNLVIASAHTGLQAAWNDMQFVSGHSQLVSRSLNALWSECNFTEGSTGQVAEPLLTKTIRGQGSAAPSAWSVPLRGQQLTGTALLDQINRWCDQGIIEPSSAQALIACANNPDWFDLSDRTIALLGAGSEAGPLRWLAKWRANIVAVDIPNQSVWNRIETIISAGNGQLHAPVRAAHAHQLANQGLPGTGSYWTEFAGADLITDTPAIALWIRSFALGVHPSSKGPFDVAAHAYLDGEKHVRVALGMDFVQRAAYEDNPQCGLAFMATPTDIFAVPETVALAAADAYARRSMISRSSQRPLRLASGDRFFQPNVESLLTSPNGKRYGIIDSIVLEQGPNYALAKRIQQWRALAARDSQHPNGGHRVSLNVAPSTTTSSVVKNAALSAGFAGADTFGIEVFEPETTNALIAALWVRDLRDPSSAANPNLVLDHPLELFMDNASHGGLWRSAYLPRSALPFAAALGWIRQRFN